MTAAVGRLVDASSGGTLGTTFAVTNRWALTAFHCVGDSDTGLIRHRRVRCCWDQDGESDAIVHDGDQFIDVALVRLDHVLPDELDPVRLIREVAEHTRFIAPGAVAAVQGVPVFWASGEVTWLRSQLENGAPAIQLVCQQSVARLPLYGLSGAPVLVGQPPDAVGVIRWNPPRDDRPELAAGATVYATPAAAVLDRWPQLHTVGTGVLDPKALIRRLAERTRIRPDATLRADVQQLLLASSLGLDEHDLAANHSVGANTGHSIEISPARTVIEVRRDLHSGAVLASAEHDLGGYLASRNRQTGERHVGVLTDGAEWRLYHHIDNSLQHVQAATFMVDPSAPVGLLSWLEAVLATGRRIKPTPDEIVRKLGAGSPAYALDAAELAAIYERSRDELTVKVRRNLWAKLLTTAWGRNFTDDDALFVDHTLLVAMAKVIGHAVIGFLRPDETRINAADIMSGVEFSSSLIGGVIEGDFFDWITDIPEGERLIRDLARRLTRFAWDQVEHDIMKILYESIIPPHIRKLLGEYYTPDWLAEEIVDKCVDDPLKQRVLDASCGSGTFLFHAIRRYVASAKDASRSTPEIIRGVEAHVIGFDVHPVAVTLARVTYLLAIGMELLRRDDRPEFTVPVYLCDSILWGKQPPLLSYGGLSVRTNLNHSALLYDPDYPGQSGLADRLRFPDRVVANSDFDRLVTELADRATSRERGTPVPSLAVTLRRFGVHDDDRRDLERTFANMCKLHDQFKDHIWGYYVRNLARPIWLARPDNRVDVLVGNPPWLAYRYMTEIQKVLFRDMSKERGLWADAHVSTHQDLSALFVARCIERYLRPGGQFGYVMPLSALSRRAYAGFRNGTYSGQEEPVRIVFGRPWDLHQVKPIFFRQSVGVIFGRRARDNSRAVPLNQVPEAWSGRFNTKTASRAVAATHISRMIGEPPPLPKRGSPYSTRFFQGATVVPRFLFMVDSHTSGPLGVGAGRRAIRSRRSSNEKKPWKDLPSLHGTVEDKFIRPLYLGESILPFYCLQPFEAVIPWDHRILQGDELEAYPGLARWWQRAEALWGQYRSSDRLSLLEQLDFRRKLSQQFPAAEHRVVYTKSGMYLAAAIVSNPDVIIDHKLYWGAAANLDEAHFLSAILNSTVLTMAVRYLQARGEHNPRDFDKYIFRLPIPPFDSSEAAHQQLVALAERAKNVARGVHLPAARFETRRRCIREALANDGVAADIDAIIKKLLA